MRCVHTSLEQLLHVVDAPDAVHLVLLLLHAVDLVPLHAVDAPAPSCCDAVHLHLVLGAICTCTLVLAGMQQTVCQVMRVGQEHACCVCTGPSGACSMQ